MIERFGAVKLGDEPLTVVGEALEVGERLLILFSIAPTFPK